MGTVSRTKRGELPAPISFSMKSVTAKKKKKIPHTTTPKTQAKNINSENKKHSIMDICNNLIKLLESATGEFLKRTYTPFLRITQPHLRSQKFNEVMDKIKMWSDDSKLIEFEKIQKFQPLALSEKRYEEVYKILFMKNYPDAKPGQTIRIPVLVHFFWFLLTKLSPPPEDINSKIMETFQECFQLFSYPSLVKASEPPDIHTEQDEGHGQSQAVETVRSDLPIPGSNSDEITMIV